MRRAKTFFILGIWVAVLPYLGFPYIWKNILFSISGVILSILGFMIYREHKAMQNDGGTFDNFSENKNFILNEIAGEEGE